jgi:excisionase family DNA binding protein
MALTISINNSIMTQKHVIFSMPLPEFETLLRECIRAEMQAQNKVPAISPMELITSNEAAKILRISLTTLRKYVIDGHIPALRIKNTKRFRRDQVEAALVSIKTIKHSRSEY